MKHCEGERSAEIKEISYSESEGVECRDFDWEMQLMRQEGFINRAEHRTRNLKENL